MVDYNIFDDYNEDLPEDEHNFISIKKKIRSTDKAILFISVKGKKFWIPKKAIVYYDEEILEYHNWFTISFLKETPGNGFNNVEDN